MINTNNNSPVNKYLEIRRREDKSVPDGYVIEVAVVHDIGIGQDRLLDILTYQEQLLLKNGRKVAISIGMKKGTESRSEQIQDIINMQ